MAHNDGTDAVSHVYANSLFELAEQAGGLDMLESVRAEFEEVVALTDQDPAFGEFVRSRMIPVEQKGESLRKIFEGQISDLLLRFLLVVNRKERLDHLKSIFEAYQRQVWERQGRVEVEVYSPRELEAEHLDRVREGIRAALGKEPIVRVHLDPSMIGGLKMRIGDRLIDASVATRLGQIRERLAKGGMEAVRSRLSKMLVEETAS